MQNIIQAVNEIMGEKYPQIHESTFTYHRIYRVGIGQEAHQSIPLIFGTSKWWRLKLHFKNIRKTAPFHSLKMHLPLDAVFFYRDDKEGVIITSPQNNFVLKIFRDPPHILLLNREIETLKKIKGTTFEKFSTTYLSDGTTKNGARWVLTDFRGNEQSLKNYKNFEKNWLSISYTQIMPRMAEFYKLNNPEFISVDEWLTHVRSRITSHPQEAVLKRSLDQIAELKSAARILTSINHFDLHTGNVLRNSQSEYSIIDWEGCYRAPVVIDAFDFLRRYLQKNRGEFKNFSTLSEEIFEKYRHWVHQHFKEVPLDQELHFQIYAIERTLFFWEIAQINRLEDKRGIEKFLLQGKFNKS